MSQKLNFPWLFRKKEKKKIVEIKMLDNRNK